MPRADRMRCYLGYRQYLGTDWQKSVLGTSGKRLIVRDRSAGRRRRQPPDGPSLERLFVHFWFGGLGHTPLANGAKPAGDPRQRGLSDRRILNRYR